MCLMMHLNISLKVSWNPNFASHDWLVAGNEGGVILVMKVKQPSSANVKLKSVEQNLKNQLTQSHSNKSTNTVIQ